MYTGLSEYPGYYCYDASRPSWLPNWLDTLTESTCKLKAVPGNIIGCLNPTATGCSPDSLVNLNVASGAPNYDPTVSGAGVASPTDPNNTPDASNLTVNSTTVLYAAAAFAVLMLLTRN